MTWRERLNYWLTGEIPASMSRKRKIDALLNDHDRLMAKVQIALSVGNMEQAKNIWPGLEKIMQRIGRIEAGEEEGKI